MTLGLVIYIEDESGSQIESVADDSNFLHHLLPVKESSILGGISWYEDTTFNRQQMAQFIPAWSELLSQVRSFEEKELLTTIQRFAEQCANGTHLYLKFVGD